MWKEKTEGAGILTGFLAGGGIRVAEEKEIIEQKEELVNRSTKPERTGPFLKIAEDELPDIPAQNTLIRSMGMATERGWGRWGSIDIHELWRVLPKTDPATTACKIAAFEMEPRKTAPLVFQEFGIKDVKSAEELGYALIDRKLVMSLGQVKMVPRGTLACTLRNGGGSACLLQTRFKDAPVYYARIAQEPGDRLRLMLFPLLFRSIITGHHLILPQ
ncbi:MAG TPA: hypothetical protein VF829_03110 [Candidatus Paceibacterota bacterium]